MQWQLTTSRTLTATEFAGEYELGESLGRGVSGQVFRATLRASGKPVALKEIRLDALEPRQRARVKNEATVMAQLDHPNVVRLYESVSVGSSLWLALELCSGGTLLDRLNAKGIFREDVARQQVRRLLSALQYMHGLGFAYRDLKLENVLLESDADDAQVKLADFGAADRVGPRMSGMCGTPYYMAPEMIAGERYGANVDVWSLGVVAFMLVSGQPPFNGKDEDAIMAAVLRGKVGFNHRGFEFCGPGVRDFCRAMLQRDPAKRRSAAEALQHAWLAESAPEAAPLAPGVVDALVAFGTYHALKRVGLLVLAFCLDPQDEPSLRELRDAFNAAAGGPAASLSRAELVAAGAPAAAAAQLPEHISFMQFVASTMDESVYAKEEHLREAFRRLDVDHSGHIDEANLRQLLPGHEYDVSAMLSEVALDAVTFEYFDQIMRSQDLTKIEFSLDF